MEPRSSSAMLSRPHAKSLQLVVAPGLSVPAARAHNLMPPQVCHLQQRRRGLQRPQIKSRPCSSRQRSPGGGRPAGAEARARARAAEGLPAEQRQLVVVLHWPAPHLDPRVGCEQFNALTLLRNQSPLRGLFALGLSVSSVPACVASGKTPEQPSRKSSFKSSSE